MSLLRAVVSGLSIILGAFFIAWWAVGSVIVTAVEDGTALRGVTERALNSPDVMSALAEQLTDEVTDALEDQGVNVGRFDDAITGAFEAGVSTEAFRAAVLAEVDAVHAEFSDALTDSLREPAPLTLTLDLSDAANDRIDDIGPLVGSATDVAIPPVTIEVLDADTFEYTREAYERTVWAKQWGLWVGIGLLAVGILVSERKRWFFAKVLFVLGLISLAFGGAIALLGPDTITTFMPGGADGPLATLWREVVTEEAAPEVMARSLWLGAGAWVAALLVVLIGAIFGSRRR